MEILQRHLSHFKEISSLFCTYLPFQDYKFIICSHVCTYSMYISVNSTYFKVLLSCPRRKNLVAGASVLKLLTQSV